MPIQLYQSLHEDWLFGKNTSFKETEDGRYLIELKRFN